MIWPFFPFSGLGSWAQPRPCTFLTKLFGAKYIRSRRVRLRCPHSVVLIEHVRGRLRSLLRNNHRHQNVSGSCAIDL
jgi:hypothetical protein